MRLEQLDVAAEVRAEVATGPERDHDRLEPPDRERDREEDGGGPASLGQSHGQKH